MVVVMVALPALDYFAHAIAALVSEAAIIAFFIRNSISVRGSPVWSVAGQSAGSCIFVCLARARCLHMVAQRDLCIVRLLDLHNTVEEAVTTPVSTLQVKAGCWEHKRLTIIMVGKAICRAAESKICGIHLWIVLIRTEPRINCTFSCCTVVGRWIILTDREAYF